MELRYKKRIKHYGDMFNGENHTYETVLQFKDIDDKEWTDVKIVK